MKYNLDLLEKIARMADPSLWVSSSLDKNKKTIRSRVKTIQAMVNKSPEYESNNSKFVKTFTPDTILYLLSEIRRVRADKREEFKIAPLDFSWHKHFIKIIHEALRFHNGNKTHSAAALGISVRSLRNHILEYDELKEYRQSDTVNRNVNKKGANIDYMLSKAISEFDENISSAVEQSIVDQIRSLIEQGILVLHMNIPFKKPVRTADGRLILRSEGSVELRCTQHEKIEELKAEIERLNNIIKKMKESRDDKK